MDHSINDTTIRNNIRNQNNEGSETSESPFRSDLHYSNTSYDTSISTNEYININPSNTHSNVSFSSFGVLPTPTFVPSLPIHTINTNINHINPSIALDIHETRLPIETNIHKLPILPISSEIKNNKIYSNIENRSNSLQAFHERATSVNSIIKRNRPLSWAEKAQNKNATIEDAFRALHRGVESENVKRYREALNFYMDSSEMLSTAAEIEKDTLIHDLLLHKAYEVLEWAIRLSSYLETDMSQPPIQRKAESVAIHLEKRRAGATGSILNNNNNTKISLKTDDHLMYYTPVTSTDPAFFSRDGYQLLCLRQGRKPSLLIVITMYNEDADELRSTLRKCCNNIQYLMDHSLPGYEGEDAWKNVLVCIVSDGKKKANPSTLEYLNQIGLYDENVINIISTGIDTKLHLFEKIVNLNKDSNHKKNKKKFPPLQLIYALKEENSGKLNSHLWYFNAFAAQINPEYTGLLDVGTMPTKSAFYRLLSAMELNQQIGGVCGEIAVDKPLPNLGNFIIASQHYEYKVSNLLDKAMESCFGYISVLPGAFSAYRYIAIKGEPLGAYFKSLTTPMSELGPFQGNMYLAEDRILAFEVLAKKNCNWTMHYVKDAIARTDVPTNLTSLIGQRRRWLNGSFFAMLFGIMQWYRVYTESNHSIIRKLFFTIQYIFMIIQTILSWFLPGTFHLAIYYVVVDGFSKNQWGFIDTSNISLSYKDLFSAIINGTYGMIMLLQLIYGMGNKPKHIYHSYNFTAIYFGILMGFAFLIAVLIFINAETYTYFQMGFATAILGVYFLAALLHFEIHHIILSFFQYLVMLPTFINVLTVYSFCNLHDLSWGTKGIDTNHNDSNTNDLIQSNNIQEKGTYEDIIIRKKLKEARIEKELKEQDHLKKRFDSFRSNLLYIWILSNVLLVGLCIYFISSNTFLPILYIIVGSFNIFRFIGSIAYLLYLLRQRIIFNCLLHCGILEKRYQKKKLEKTSIKNDSFISPVSIQTSFKKLNV